MRIALKDGPDGTDRTDAVDWLDRKKMFKLHKILVMMERFAANVETIYSEAEAILPILLASPATASAAEPTASVIPEIIPVAFLTAPDKALVAVFKI